jgi:hypothetical protein
MSPNIDAKSLRDRAAEIRALSVESDNAQVKAGLLRLAREYEARADQPSATGVDMPKSADHLAVRRAG